MEPINFQEQNFYKEQTSSYRENYITYPFPHLRGIKRRRQGWQQELNCEEQYEKQNIFNYDRKHMQTLNFEEQEFLHYNQKRNSNESHYHRGNFSRRPFQSDIVQKNSSIISTTEPINFQYDNKSRSAHNEDDHLISCTRAEEKFRRRQDWLQQQEYERQHEKLKQQKILEYERNRAQALKLAEQKSSHRSRSRSDSKSPPPRHYRGRTASNASKSGTLSEKEAVVLFKDQGTSISLTELRRIKVEFYRNISTKETVSEMIQRDIVNFEDIVLERREGEGCKPIFDRRELKSGVLKKQHKIATVTKGVQTVSTTKDQFSQTSESPLQKFQSYQIS